MKPRFSRFLPLAYSLLALCGGLFAVNLADAQTKAQYDLNRKRMVTDVIIGSGIKDERVIKAMGDTPRHEFVEPKYRNEAYFDKALPIGDKQTISSPFIVAFMTQSLDPKATDRVLEIGTGSGFQAAVLSPLVKDVYSIEIVESLGNHAKKVLKHLGYENVHTKVGDGYQGWIEHAPFDKIIVTCSPEKVPQALVDQLKEGGLIVVPVGERYSQTLYLLRKKDGKMEEEALLPTLFVPMTGKAEDARAVKPDPANPKVANGSFEEEAFESGAQPGWYYERHVTWKKDAKSPDGEHYIEFTNSDPGVSAHLLQGFAIDGRKVKQLDVSAWVRLESVFPGHTKNELPFVAMTIYDENRRELALLTMGPFRGTADWHEESKRFDIPVNAREGILRIGLFGATGTASFDKIQMKKVENTK